MGNRALCASHLSRFRCSVRSREGRLPDVGPQEGLIGDQSRRRELTRVFRQGEE